jgi:flagellar basal-body rod protein FlgB
MSVTSLLSAPAAQAAERVISFAGARQNLIADAIANIDTPGYRRRDLSESTFEAGLADALKRADRANPNLPRLEPEDAGATTRPVEEKGLLVFHDDNDRSVERLMVDVAQNRMKLNQAVNLLRVQLRQLRTVITERPGG